MGWESRSTLDHGGGWVPSQQIFMLRSLPADRLHNAVRDMSEQIGSSMWLGLCFTFHPTAFSVLVTKPFLSPLPFASELTPEENSLQVLQPLRTYSKLPLSSTCFETPLPIHIDSPSTSSQISVPKTYTSSSQRVFCGRHLLFPQLRCFWWGIQVLQWPKFFLEA